MARAYFIRDLFKSRTTNSPFLSSAPSSFCTSTSSNPTSKNKYRKFRRRVLKFLNSCQSLTHFHQIQAHLITSGLLNDPSFSGRALKISSSLNDLSYSLFIFKSLQFYDAFCVNTVIKALSCSSVLHHTIAFYFKMLEIGFSPNNFSFPPLISACAKMGCLKSGEKCQGQAVKHGVDGILNVQNSLIHLYACCGLMDIARQVFDGMLVKDIVSWNTIVGGFGKVGEMGVAHRLFDAMPEKNVVSWNVMISGYLNFGNPGNGLKLFRKMVKMGFRGNDTTMVNVTTACGRSARLKEGKSIHGSLIRENVNFSLIISTALIDMYSRCGRVDIARVIFDRMTMRNLISWNAMILGHCIHGDPVEGLSLFSEMVGAGKILDRVDPDEITFIGVLCACARKELLTEGRNYLSQMTDVYDLKPSFAHYWCIANLYAQVGLMQDAVEILRKVQFVEDANPASSMWAALLALSRFQGEVNLGAKLAKELIEQDPQNFSYYALLMNIYAVAGRWEEVAHTKELMKEKGIKRVPDNSLKELKELVHNTVLELNSN